MKRPLLHVIDGSGYIFRAYYAIRSLSTPEGESTNAVYGFTTMIEKALREEQPELLAITFDAGGPNFRRDIYPEYKANRAPPPEDLSSQIPRIHQISEAFRIRTFVEQGVEADDVIATLVKRALAEGYDVRLITGDKDLMQLVNDRVTVYEPMKGQRFGPEEVKEKMGVAPALLADALALSGDSSDNVPGVRGVGPKSAAKLLETYGGLEGVLAAATAGKIKGKMGETLAASVDAARLSRRLMALREDVPLDIEGLEDLRYPGPDKEVLRRLYTELDFRRLIPKLDDAAAEDEEEAPATPQPTLPHVSVTVDRSGYQVVQSSRALEAAVAQVAAKGQSAWALELSDDKVVDAALVGVALCAERGKAFYVPVGSAHGVESLNADAVVAALSPLLEDAEHKKLSPETKALVGWFGERGVAVRGLAFDTTLASYLLEPDETQHGPAAVARRFLGHEVIDRAALLRDEKKKRREFSQVPLQDAAPSVGERADVALAAARLMAAPLKEADVHHVLSDVELPLVPVLAKMERAGIRVDVRRLAGMGDRFAEEAARLEKLCFEAAGQEFNLGSPKQLQKVLFEDLGLKITKRTKTGPSTDASVLEALADEHPLPEALLQYRQVEKLKNTYVDALPKMVSKRTGRVHTVFNQATAATGRLSSHDPNLQNIPIRTELGRELRKVFLASDGNLLVSVDYSQIELRVLAHFCQDAVLVKAFQENADVHTRTAAALFEVPPEEITREQRTQAKAVNFGVLYGMGPVRLARDLKIPRRTASQFVKDYFERQPGVRRFIDDTLEDARKTGQVRTLLGRRRLISDINSRNRGARAQAERIATNTPIQGSAADLIKLAMIRVSGVLEERFPEVKLLLQVHDELLLEAPEAQAEDVAAMVKKEMEGIFPLEVPLVAEAHVGKNWDDAH
jgi:DNA polymerase-1